MTESKSAFTAKWNFRQLHNTSVLCPPLLWCLSLSCCTPSESLTVCMLPLAAQAEVFSKSHLWGMINCLNLQRIFYSNQMDEKTMKPNTKNVQTVVCFSAFICCLFSFYWQIQIFEDFPDECDTFHPIGSTCLIQQLTNQLCRMRTSQTPSSSPLFPGGSRFWILVTNWILNKT